VDRLVSQPANQAERVYLELVAEMQTAILNYLFRLVGDVDTAEDLTQETFLRAYRALHRLDLEETAQGRRRAWLYRIAHNAAADHHRRRSRLDWVPLGSLLRAPRSDPGVVSEERDPVRRALAHLDPDAREVLLLFNYEGLDTREVAAVLDISEEAARKRRQRARAQFMTAYEAELHDV
jgi:RNA polymerase sigma-70 factor (ECF subfamily)